MGYSATSAALRTLDTIIELAQKQRPHTGQNCWYGDDGREYFYEIGKEQKDGAVIGVVQKQILKKEWHPSWGEYNPNSVRKAGSFRINPDGTIARFPGLPKAVRAKIM